MDGGAFFETSSVDCIIAKNSKDLHPLITNLSIKNIAKGTTDPGVDCFDQSVWFGRFGLVGLVGLVW